jgi:hypothetical protein
MRRLTLRKFLLAFFAGALLATSGMMLLPQDKFLRYQSLNDHSAPNAFWIYQRIHQDETPIDIAFIGTSRTGRSVHTKRLQERLETLGVNAHAVNFHVVKTGRNMHFAIAKELLSNRRVKLLVLEITELEDRKPHPDFIFLADAQDIVFAPLFINVRYFADLARLPGRQTDLFFETQLQRLGWRRPEFVVPPYEGENMDRTEYLLTLDGVNHPLDHQHSLAEMKAMEQAQEAEITPSLLPPSLERLEYRYPRYYVDRILDLAASNGTKVVFLYLPRYGGPPMPPMYERIYAARAGLINPWPAMQDYRLWADETHVNWIGSQRVTDAVADAMVRGAYLK